MWGGSLTSLGMHLGFFLEIFHFLCETAPKIALFQEEDLKAFWVVAPGPPSPP